jgi:zinc protease
MKTVSCQLLFVSRSLFLTGLLILSFVFTNFAQQAGKPSISEQASLVTEFEVNGLKVLVKRRVNSPTVAASLFIRGGARNITDKNAGIENMMLETSTEASKNFPRETLRRELSKTGTAIGAGANKDYSALSLATTRQNFDRSWEIFTDIATNPTFADKDIVRTREKIAVGLREQETDNDNFLQVLQDRIIYANHPYSNNVSGTLDTITRFTAKDLSDYHNKVMQTSQLLLVVVGDVDANDLRKRVADTLGKLPRGNYKEQTYPAVDFSKPTLDITQRTLPTNYIQGVFSAPSLNNPDYSAMRVAITILQSLVNNEVRTKRQLSYAPNAELGTELANTANIYVTAVEANTAVEVMLQQIEFLKTKALNEEVISNISEFYLTNYYLAQETNGAQAGELAKYELTGGGWRNSFDFLDRIKKVTPDDVKAVSNKYMKNIRFIVIGNPSAIKREVFLSSN